MLRHFLIVGHKDVIEVGKGKYIFSMSFRRSSRLPQGVKNASAAPIKSVEFNWVKSRSSPNIGFGSCEVWRMTRALEILICASCHERAFLISNYCSNSTIMINSPVKHTKTKKNKKMHC